MADVKVSSKLFIWMPCHSEESVSRKIKKDSLQLISFLLACSVFRQRHKYEWA